MQTTINTCSILRVPSYRGALISVSVDGKELGNIIFSPYMCSLSDVAPGEHVIDLTLYGTRQNGFAQLHHANSMYFYQNPDSWRSKGDLWCEKYQLKPVGILKSPQIYIITDGIGEDA